MNDLLEQLHDIDGLDHISSWPLAIGWWVLITLGIILVVAIAYFAASRLAFRRSWRHDTFKKLAVLEANLSDTTSKETVIRLSEYLRRIALRRFPRKECAGLVGEAWLQWLTVNDPKYFDWETKGTLLIDTPYAPIHSTIPVERVKDLIQAIKEWVR